MEQKEESAGGTGSSGSENMEQKPGFTGHESFKSVEITRLEQVVEDYTRKL